MAEGIDQAANAFRDAVGGPERAPARDTSGRFRENTPRPESLFAERQTEGDAFGDTRDGGEDVRRRRQEARANGDPFEDGAPATRSRKTTSQAERQGRQRNESDGEGRVNAPADERHETFGDERREEQGDDESESQDQGALSDDDEQTDDERELPDGDAGEDAEGEGGEGSDQRYEVTVDGKPMEVTLKQALEGYIRTETFHQRMNKVNEASQTVMAEAQRVAQVRDHYINQNAALEQEIMTLLPQQPDWEAEFQRDPKSAYSLRKQYEAVDQKLQALRQARGAAMQERAAEQARSTETYAKDQFARFVMDNKISDEGALRKELNSMRRTAMTAGFSEQEVATVYDARMLSVLRKASKYDRLMAAKPRAVVPGKGRALTPGSAPRIGNAGRRNIDEAQSRLAKSGRIDDAASVFEKIIR
jgi:hypothetical protein